MLFFSSKLIVFKNEAKDRMRLILQCVRFTVTFLPLCIVWSIGGAIDRGPQCRMSYSRNVNVPCRVFSSYIHVDVIIV